MPHIDKADRRDRTARRRRTDRKTCVVCKERRALFIINVRKRKGGTKRLGRRKVVKTDRDHNLCGECRRSIGDWFYTNRYYGSGAKGWGRERK